MSKFFQHWYCAAYPTQRRVVHRGLDAVLAGRFRLVMQGRSAVLEAGDAIEVPGGVLHSAEVIGDSPVVSLDAIRV